MSATAISPELSKPAEADLVSEFHHKGFAIINPCIPGFEALAESVIKDLHPLYYGRGRLQDAWTYHSGVRALAAAPQILSLLQCIFKRKPIPFQTLNFPQGTEQPAHSDTIHFQTDPPGFMCGVWTALEDTDTCNGPLVYYPGSHKLPFYSMQALGLEPKKKNYASYEQKMREHIEANGFRAEQAHLRKGQSLIWHANLLHGGSPVLDRTRTRHSQVTHYFFSDCIYYTPKGSDYDSGDLLRREVVDICSNKVIPHLKNGKRIPVKVRDSLIARCQRFVNRHPRLIGMYYKYIRK